MTLLFLCMYSFLSFSRLSHNEFLLAEFILGQLSELWKKTRWPSVLTLLFNALQFTVSSSLDDYLTDFVAEKVCFC